jgi:hypothetical protein
MQWWDGTKKKLKRLYAQRVGRRAQDLFQAVEDQEIIRRPKMMLIGIKVTELMRRTRPKTCFRLNEQSVQLFGGFAATMTRRFVFFFVKSFAVCCVMLCV